MTTEAQNGIGVIGMQGGNMAMGMQNRGGMAGRQRGIIGMAGVAEGTPGMVSGAGVVGALRGMATGVNGAGNRQVSNLPTGVQAGGNMTNGQMSNFPVGTGVQMGNVSPATEAQIENRQVSNLAPATPVTGVERMVNVNVMGADHQIRQMTVGMNTISPQGNAIGADGEEQVEEVTEGGSTDGGSAKEVEKKLVESVKKLEEEYASDPYDFKNRMFELGQQALKTENNITIGDGNA